jgi:hypothetical protein
MKQPQNKYMYEITNRLGVIQSEPLGESNFTLEWNRENEGKLDYKNSLPNKIVFTGDVFQNLLKLEKSIYRCDFQNITVKRRCTSGTIESWVPWFTGRMSLNEGLWDLDRCEVEIKLDDIKEDECFENNKTKEINLLETIGPRRTVFLNPTNITIEKINYTRTDDMTTGDCFPVYWGGTGDPSTQGWIYYHYQYEEDTASNHCFTSTDWARETIIVACGDPSPGPEWILVNDTCPGGDRKYARPARTYGCTYTFPNFDDVVQTTTYTCNIVGDAAANISIDNGLSLNDVANVFMSRFCPGLTFVSNFLQVNPSVASSINYVTGQLSKTRFITLYQKSDVKRPTASGNATKAVLSFEKLLNALIEMFNLRWRIEASTFRVEHVSYFPKNQGLDLTLPKYAKFVIGKRKYSYQIESIPAREEFKFMEAGFGDFQGVPIIYSGGCVTQGSRDSVKTHNVEKITTDLELVLGNPDPDSQVVSDDGFVMVAADFDGTNYFVISEAPILGGSTLNNSLAWAQLHRDYHKWDRPLISGNMNNIDTEFITSKPTKKGDKITIPLCCGDVFDPDDTIKTALGEGIVDKAVFSFKDETLELELLYPADKDLVDNTAPVANNDVVATYQNNQVQIDVLSNDTDPDPGAQVSAVVIVIGPMNGIAIVQADKTILYTPSPGYIGSDNITYKIQDEWGQSSNNALIAITVRPPNAAPIATNDSYIGQKNTVLNVAAPGVFANDSDDVSFTLDTFDAASVQGGTVVVNTDGSLSYTPPTGYVGIDTFTYTIRDTPGLTDTATVTIDVRDPNNPIANDDGIYVTPKNQNLVVAAPGLLANDSTAIGTLTATPGTFATTSGGSVTIASNGSFTYLPPTDFEGLDTFTYTADNGTGTDTATATIRVLPNIWVRLQQVTFNLNHLTAPCGSPPSSTHTGESETGVFRLFFYSNSGGTIPLDVTGLNLTVNYRVTGTYFGMPGSYNIDFNVSVSGTTFDLYGGTPYQYFIQETDCDGNVINYTNESLTLQPGNYAII